MSYAIRNDLKGCRSINHADDVAGDEHFSITPLLAVEPSPGELAEVAKNHRSMLLAGAVARMGPLQDAVDIGDATEDEIARLNLWKRYRVELNRIEQQAGFPSDISWPSSPDGAGA